MGKSRYGIIGTMEAMKIHFAIHDLNETGGQDRSTLEILRRIKTPFCIHAYTLSDPKLVPYFEPVRPNLRRPVLLKILYFYFKLLFQGDKIWHATGVSHFRSNIIHLQFIHSSWEKQNSHPFSLRGLYSKTLALFNIWLEKICFTPEKTYIAISKQVANELKKEFGIEKNVEVIHHGVDVTKFSPGPSKIREELGISSEEICLLFVGSFERKGLECTLRALAKASVQCTLLILGEGNVPYYKNLADSLGLTNIRFLGKQPGVERYFQASDVFLLPTQYEPFGLVILEALACGLPVIASRCAGASELITHGQEGFLLEDPKDSEELAKNIRSIVMDGDLRKRMKVAARKVALENTWDHVAAKYDKVLSNFLRQKT